MSIPNLTLMLITIGSLYFTNFELKSALYANSKTTLEDSIKETLRELKFLSPTEKDAKLADLINSLDRLSAAKFNTDKTYTRGKLDFIRGLESDSTEFKLNQICEARSEIQKALTLAPRNIKYQLEIADIESISSSLISTCDSLNLNDLAAISHSERLEWVNHLAPNDPPTIYKKGLIERSIGERISSMKSFRKFEENSLVSKQDFRNFFLSQPETAAELYEILPRKYPNILNWLADYSKNPNPNINFKPIFEKVIIETISKIEKDQTKDHSETLDILYRIYWTPQIQYSEPVKQNIIKLAFKSASLSAHETFAKDFFGTLLNTRKIPNLISTSFSGISKKSGQIYNWISSNDPNLISLDIRSGNLGLFMPSEAKAETMIIQGGKGDRPLRGLKATFWASDDNVNFSQIENIQAIKTGAIDNRPIAIFNVPSVTSKYIKISLALENGKTQRINAPANLIIQFYSKQ